MEKVLRVYESFEEAEAADRAFYRGLTPEARLQILFSIIEDYEAGLNESERRLQRVLRVVERHEL